MKQIFVFGSNLAGRHGRGAAYAAYKRWGAIYGVGTGRQGDSFAIATKDFQLHRLPLDAIEAGVKLFFLPYASAHPELQFLVTRIGCGLAGYTDEQIAPMFKDAPSNCILPDEWKRLLDSNQ